MTKHDDQTGISSVGIISLISSAVLLILFTRLISVHHNINLHPDEPVFYKAADSLMRYLTGSADAYTEIKEYPEGAIVLQLPFHIVAAAIYNLFGKKLSMQLCGRVASIFYFCCGAICGMIIEYRHFGKNRKSVLAYGLILLFSIMHIEQSRYGTGDAISFFLIMLILLLVLRRKDKDKSNYPFWIFTGFLSGLLCSVKYPLLFWGLLPFIMAWKTEEKENHRRLCALFLFICMVTIGFLLGSPKVWSDPYYIIRAIKRETKAYIINGNITEVGGPLNHLLSLTLYSFLYAGFPLAPVFVLSVWKERKEHYNKDDSDAFLLSFLLPVLIVVFFLYNVFVKTLFMRTYYPFFFLTDLYVAEYLGKQQCKNKQVAIFFLTCLFIGRSSYYIGVLTERYGPDRLDALIGQAADKSWCKTTLLMPGYFIDFNRDSLVDPHTEQLINLKFENERDLLIDVGEMVITGSIEYGRGQGYVFAVDNEDANQHYERWEAFKRMNSNYFVGSIYPQIYYYLFGYWIKGTTGCPYEFPTNYVYYRGMP